MTINRRSGFILLQVVAILPLFLVFAVITSRLVARVIIVQQHDQQRQEDEARMEDLVRRIRRDAARAAAVTRERDRTSIQFQFDKTDGTVMYKIDGKHVTRVVTGGDAQGLPAEWAFKYILPELRLEPDAGTAKIVWMSFAIDVTARGGVARPLRLSTATALGGGGRL